MKFFWPALFIFLLSCPLTGTSQQHFLDSLTSVYQTSESEKERAELAIEISHNYVNVNNEKAHLFADKALIHANKLKDQMMIAKSYEAKASVFTSTGETKKALDLYLQTLSIYEHLRDQKEIAQITNNIANTYLGIDDYEKAQDYFLRSYDAGILATDTNAIAVPLVGLAILYEQEGNVDKALESTLDRKSVV